MKEFRFVILGAGNIAGKFCEAVSLIGAQLWWPWPAKASQKQ